MRSVDADAILEKIDKEREYLVARGQLGAEHILVKYCRDFVEDAPTVELDESVIQEVLNKRCMTAVANEHLIALYDKRPQGEWILNPLGDYVCSKCSFVVGKIERNFCPDCGVKMRSDEE